MKGVDKHKTCYYIKSYIQGTSFWDYFGLVPLINRLFPAIKIYFAKPEKVKEVLEDDVKETVSKLENDYRKWVNESLFYQQNK